MDERGGLRVATYNVHGCVGTDGRHDPDRVAAVVAELGVDLIGLQEVDAGYNNAGRVDQLDHLRRATGLHAVAGPTLHNAHGDYGNALLTTLPPVAVRRHDLSFARREPRGALDVELDWHGRDVRIVVTHFGTSLREQRHQVARLVEALRPDLTPRLVLLGDFNGWHPVAHTARRLDALLGRSRGVRSFPSRRPLLSLDRIWARPEGSLVDLAAHRSPLARVASDHLPVAAEIRLG